MYMSIKKVSTFINGLTIAAVALTGFLLFSLTQRINDAGAAAASRFYTALLMDELRKSFEEQTRQARNFAATGSAPAHTAYFRALAKRRGEEPRPAYALIAPGQRRGLLDLLGEHGITYGEFTLLEQAIALSGTLAALEAKAKNAVKGIFLDAAGQFTIHGEPDMELARSLVFGSAYYAGLEKVMAYANEFEYMVNTRTQRAIDNAVARKNAAIIIFALAFVFIFLLAAINLVYNRKFVAGPISSLTEKIKHMNENDLIHGININMRHNNELSDLVNYFNETLGKITALIVTVRKEADSLAKVGGDLAHNMNETTAAMNEVSARIQSIKTRMFSKGASVKQANVSIGNITANMNNPNIIRAEKQFSTVSGYCHRGNGRNGLTEVIEEIQAIARESEDLMEINAVMQNIANQAGFLSMNHAIEAAHKEARADEAGKGFAAIDDEIRKLAESSSEQSKTIGTVLKKMKSSIDKITLSTFDVSRKFEIIVNNIRTAAEQNENIRNAMKGKGEKGEKDEKE